MHIAHKSNHLCRQVCNRSLKGGEMNKMRRPGGSNKIIIVI